MAVCFLCLTFPILSLLQGGTERSRLAVDSVFQSFLEKSLWMDSHLQSQAMAARNFSPTISVDLRDMHLMRARRAPWAVVTSQKVERFREEHGEACRYRSGLTQHVQSPGFKSPSLQKKKGRGIIGKKIDPKAGQASAPPLSHSPSHRFFFK